MTRKTIFSSLAILVITTLALAYLHLVSNSNYIASVSLHLRAFSARLAVIDPEMKAFILSQTRDRIALYNDLIKRNQLYDGMVANRRFNGAFEDTCDSLLFSSLRFTALHKLGLKEDAEEAWRAIEKSQTNGNWHRHPKCLKPTSRDMILGVLVALSQKPNHYATHLKNFLKVIDKRKGFFGDGSASVSYLTPALAEIVRKMAKLEGIPYKEMPSYVRSGFSTAEFDASISQGGYKAHLVSLLVWLEFELQDAHQISELSMRSLMDNLTLITKPFTVMSISKQRLEYITQRLVEIDPKNLFFKYLRFRAAKAMTTAVRVKMLEDLLALRQLPQSYLPMNCTSGADYLWQRHSVTYPPRHVNCDESYSGVDFLWLSALLLEDPTLKQAPEPSILAH